MRPLHNDRGPGEPDSVRRLSRLGAPAVLASLLGSGCAPSLDLNVTIDPEARDPARVTVEVHADVSCDEVASAGTPLSPLYSDDVAPGEAVAALPDLPRGRYAATATAFDAACRVVARGCADLELPSESALRELVATALPVTARGECAAIASCDRGRCSAGTSTRACLIPTETVAGSPGSAPVAFVRTSRLETWEPGQAMSTEVHPRPDGPIATGRIDLRAEGVPPVSVDVTCGVFGGGLRCVGLPAPGLRETDELGVRAVRVAMLDLPVTDWLAVRVGAGAICGIEQRVLPMREGASDAGAGVACATFRSGMWSIEGVLLEEVLPAVSSSSSEFPVALEVSRQLVCVLRASGDVECFAPFGRAGMTSTVASGVSAMAMGAGPDGDALCVVGSDDGRLRCGVLSLGMPGTPPTVTSWAEPAEIIRPSAIAVRDQTSGCALVTGRLVCWGALEGSRITAGAGLAAFPLDEVVVSSEGLCVRSLAGDLRCGPDGGDLACVPAVDSAD